MSNKVRRLVFELLFFVVLVIFDQFTKSLAVKYLMNQPAKPIIKNVLELYYLPNGNTGAAFGMLQGHQMFFVVIAIIVVCIIGYILFFMPFDKRFNILNVLLVFIAAGGIGNLIDRISQNFVVDFIYFSIINFPIFNVADIYVSVSTIILAIYFIFCIKEADYERISKSLKAPFNKNKHNDETV